MRKHLAYDLSAYLANILSPLTGKSEFTVTNSAHFVSTISSETIRDNEIMVSFDVESLFTNVPIDAAVQAALQRLENDPSLADRTTLTPAQIADLLTFVLRSTYFQYNGSIYEQKDGAAMGSPVSAVIANLYMESFEEQAINTSSYKPTIWKRYVDDTFTILDHGNVDDFLQHLNNQQPSIRFTMETENNNKLAFLDTAVSREPDGRLTTSVYRKPTHTDQYLAYDPHHPQSVKRGIVKCLYERAKRLVTKPSVISEEKKHWFLMVILFLSCRNSPRPEDQTTVPNPPSSSKLLRFCLMSKVCPNNFAVPYNNKAYALFSSRILR